MILKSLRAIIRSTQKLGLYARVAFKRMTLKKAYVLLRYGILTNVLRKKIPWVLELSITYRCQCKCVHCSVGTYLAQARMRDELTTAEIKNILDQAVEIGIPKVDYFGGEPLLRKDIVELVQYGENKGLHISITTNGLLMTRELTNKLSRAGISCINISIDSTSEEEHDSFRGVKMIYKSAVNAFRFCYEEGIPTIFSTYVTHDRIKNLNSSTADDSELSKLISMAREIKASGVRLLFPIISGKWVDSKEKEFTDEEKMFVVDNMDPSFVFIEGAYSVVKKKKVCQSLSGKMFNISPYGDVQLCVVFPESFGNVRDRPLSDLITGMYNHSIYLQNKGGSCCSTTELIKS